MVFGRHDETNSLCDVVEKYVKKGSKLYIEGKMQTRKYKGQDGVERYTTEIVLQGFGGQLVLLDRGEGGSRPPPPDSADDYGSTSTRRPSAYAPAFDGGMDDDIPF